MIKNVLLKVAYDGRDFYGFQSQTELRNVEDELKKAINKATGEDNRIIAAGRTDSGVHAYAQYVNFLTATDISPAAFRYHLDPLLPDDILALESKEVDLGFHARFSAKSKTYRYVINKNKVMHPIHRAYMEQVTYPLDLELMDEGLKVFIGEHDFKAFMRNDKDLEINTVRKIEDAYLIDKRDILELYFKGESFLHNQVRLMVGTLVEVGRGKLSIEELRGFFKPDNDKKAGPALSAAGLYLWSIDYD